MYREPSRRQDETSQLGSPTARPERGNIHHAERFPGNRSLEVMDASAATGMQTGAPNPGATSAGASLERATSRPRAGRWTEPLRLSGTAGQAGGGSTSPTTNRAVRIRPDAGQVPHLDTQRRQRLEAISAQRPEILVTVDDQLSKARLLVNEFERWQRAVRSILVRSQRQALDDEDHRALYRSHQNVHGQFENFQFELASALVELAQTRAFVPTDANRVFGLQRRFDDVRDFSLRFAAPWRRVARQVHTVLPVGSGQQATVELFATPGEALKTLVPGIYPADSRTADFSVARYYRPPAFELSGISNAGGQVLYAAVRHGFFLAHEITGDLLASQADDDALKSVLHFHRVRELQASLLVPQRKDALISQTAKAAEDDFFTVRTSPREALQALGLSVKSTALRSAFADTLTLALISNSQKHRALSFGNDVRLGIMSIALLAPEDVPAWRAQYDQFRREHPLFCRKSHGDAGRTSSAHLAFDFRHFALIVAGKQTDRDECAAVVQREAERLLGPFRSGPLGGDIGKQIDSMSEAAQGGRKQIAELDRYANEPQFYVPHWHLVHASRVARAKARLLCAIERIEKDRRTLVQAGEQLRAMWQQHRGWPTGPQALREVAPRLALVGFHMGDPPLLSCADGRDYTRQLDTEAKLLATFADNSGGGLPSTPLNTPEWNGVRDRFNPPSNSSAV